MSCPVCGEECHCSSLQAARARRLPPRFRISSESHAEQSGEPTGGVDLLVETAGEQASVSCWGGESRPRFLIAPPEDGTALDSLPVAAVRPALRRTPESPLSRGDSAFRPGDGASQGEFATIACGETTREPGWSAGETSCADWREEVTARVNKYQSRRKRREPRYPSLRLKFDPPEYSRPASPPPALPGTEPVPSPAPTRAACAGVEGNETAVARIVSSDPAGDAESNVIEFPRPFVPEPAPPDQLAEPVPDKPRILEAPEALPKQVPLGGIIIEPEETPAAASTDMPLAAAPIPMRMLAAALDMGIVLAGVAAFLAIASHFSQVTVPGRDLQLMWALLPLCLWMAYQYTFLVHAGTTPGLRIARLQLRRFDKTLPGVRQRRARVLAMTVSALSLGLGFLWALIDEDTLCWHDRITHTLFVLEAEKHSPLLLRVFGPESRLHRLLQDRIPQPPVS